MLGICNKLADKVKRLRQTGARLALELVHDNRGNRNKLFLKRDNISMQYNKNKLNLRNSEKNKLFLQLELIDKDNKIMDKIIRFSITSQW